MAHGSSERSGISGGAQHDIEQSAGELAMRNIESNTRIGVQRVLLNPADHANHGGPHRFSRQVTTTDARAQWVLVGPEWLRHILIHPRNHRLVRRILIVE